MLFLAASQQIVYEAFVKPAEAYIQGGIDDGNANVSTMSKDEERDQK
ncbi:hypothetical protein [Aureimonas sp. AU40]|nr:hypothetical protein [Aureimonas sp. AU40]